VTVEHRRADGRHRGPVDPRPSPHPAKPAGWWTLEELAAQPGMPTAASLRQRAGRGTLAGAKRLGGVQRGLWVVPNAAAQELLAEGRRR
jgi:hypothetical protein